MTMAQLEITHNPITLKTRLLLDGERIERLEEVPGDGRIQGWFLPLLDTVHETINEDTLSIIFRGIAQDARDIEEALSIIGGDRRYRLTTDTVGFSADHVASRFREISYGLESFAKEHGETNTDLELLRSVRGLIDSRAFRVTAVACVSSGKSTLLNAMMAREVLPARNEATTAKVFRIIDLDGHNAVDVIGRDRNGNVVLNTKDAALDDFNRINEREDILDVEITTDITWIDNIPMGYLELMDTPGPNNSATQEHRVLTFSQLGDSEKAPDIVLYVMDFRKQAVDDERALLEWVAREIRKGGLKANDRFFFILNFIDDRDPDREALGRALSKLEGFLDREFSIKHPRIFPVSAMAALVDRMQAHGRTPTRRQRAQIPLMDECLPSFEELLTETRCQPAVKDATRATIRDTESLHARSGLPTVQTAIVQHLEKYAMPSKLARFHTEMQNRLLSEKKKAEFEADIMSQEARLDDIQNDLRRLEAIVKRADVTSVVNARLQARRRELKAQPLAAAGRLDARIVRLLNDSEFGSGGKLNQARAKRVAASLGGQISGAAAEMEASIRAQVEDATRMIRDEVVAVFGAQLREVISAQRLNALKLPDPNMWTANLSLRLESKAARMSETVEKTRVVTHQRTVTRAWYNPKRWLAMFDEEWSTYEEEYETEEQYTIHQVDTEKFRRAVQRDLNRQLRTIRNRAEEFRDEQFEILGRRIQRLIAETEGIINEKISELRATTATRERMKAARSAAQKRQAHFTRLIEDLNTVASLGLPL